MNTRTPYAITFTMLLALCLVALCCLPGCGYPEVSPRTYEIAKALYSVSNLKRTEGIPKVETLIADSLQAGEITDREADYLNEIVECCRDGKWESAQRECRELMEDQVGVERESTPHQH